MKILVIDGQDSREFAAAIQAVSALSPRPDVSSVALDRIERDVLSRDDWQPDLTIVCQSFPEQFDDRTVHRLLDRFPLTRWIVCLGPWCESSLRTGIAWPPSLCVPARQCEGRLLAEIEVTRGQRDAMPWTASRDESVAFDAPEIPPDSPHERWLAIESPDPAMRELLLSIGRLTELRVIVEGVEPPLGDRTVRVVDVDPIGAQTSLLLRKRRAEFPADHLVAIAAFAHADDIADWHGAGVDQVIPKLRLVESVIRMVRRTGDQEPATDSQPTA